MNIANLPTFLAEVADHSLFWIGLAFIVESYIEAAAPGFGHVAEKFFKQWWPGSQRATFFRALGLVALFIASFQAWNVQYEIEQGAANRLSMKLLLGTAVEEGAKLGTNWFKRDDEAQFKHETNVWTNKTGHLIEDAYGKGETQAWLSDAGIINYSDGKVRTDMHNWIVNRLQRLNELMARVDSISMQPSFDPQHYKWVPDCKDC